MFYFYLGTVSTVNENTINHQNPHIAPTAVHVALLFIMFSEGGPDIYLHLYEGENEGYL